jgi:hypothetical protein
VSDVELALLADRDPGVNRSLTMPGYDRPHSYGGNPLLHRKDEQPPNVRPNLQAVVAPTERRG